MRSAERPRLQESSAFRQHSRDAVDLRGFKSFCESHRRQDTGESLGQHRLAGTRRAYEQDVVAPRGSNLKRALSRRLAAHISKIETLVRMGRERRRIADVPLKSGRLPEKFDRFRQMTN